MEKYTIQLLSCELKNKSQKMAYFFIILFNKKILPLSLPTCSDYKWCGIFLVTYYSTTYSKSILCICNVWIDKKLLVACTISSYFLYIKIFLYGLGWGTQCYILFISTQSLLRITYVGIFSRDAYHCQCQRHVQEGSIFPTSFQFLRNSAFSRYWYNFNDCWSPRFIF